MAGDGVVLAATGILLASCLGTFWWATRSTAAGYRHTLLIFTWLSAALAATLVIFSMFPGSSVGGDVFGFTLGGAGAFVILVWTSAIRASRVAGQRDDLERRLRERDCRIAELEEAAARTARRPQPLVFVERHLYGLRDAGSHRVGIITGDVRRVACVDVWVNSENTNMSMADPYDNSISGIIRYEASRKSPLGHVIEDVVGDELERTVAGHRPVPAGTAIVTRPGELRRNGVRRIVHAAAVLGQSGEGYRQIRDIGRCVANVLAAVDNGGTPLGRTVLLPLLGTGYGRGDVEETTRVLVGAIIAYLTEHPRTAIEDVYLLAHTDNELAVCQKVFADSDRLSISEGLLTSPR
ncbi:macro domain-containing protein [Actinomycetes bacterium KLBMP 9797]